MTAAGGSVPKRRLLFGDPTGSVSGSLSDEGNHRGREGERTEGHGTTTQKPLPALDEVFEGKPFICENNECIKERSEREEEKREWINERKKLIAERDELLQEKCEWEKEREILIERLEYQNKVGLCHGIEKVTEKLQTYLTPTQIECMLHKKPVKRWEEEDIRRAVTLRSFSPKAYNYLRETMKFPLPSAATLKRWLMKLDVEPGLLLPVMKLLHHKSASMNQYQRLCVLSFDETSVAHEWTYDKGTDTLYGPKRYVQCAMLRGLTCGWKQIIYYDFDKPMTRKTLFDIITKSEEAGFIVVAMVHDLGPTNMKLWKTLDISTEKTYFKNPAAPERKIFVFADAPHLLKLIRNNFIDHGFTLEGNKQVSSECQRASHQV